MLDKTLKIATRQSPLALWQANHIKDQIKHFWPAVDVELLPMKTTGDKFLKNKLVNEGGKGLFVKELEEALLNGQADLAVHSMKDVPVTFPTGLTLPVICKRHNPFDALVSKTYENLNALPFKATVGTVSLRRHTQLLHVRPDLQIKPLRGNILTRISRMKAGEFDAIILAVSGLTRMGMADHIKEIISDEIMLPACGQGALGIECRTDDEALQQLLAPLNDADTFLCVQTERRINTLLGGNCHTPLAAFCTLDENSNILLRARVTSLNGQTLLSSTLHGARIDAATLAERCADILLTDGAGGIIAEAAKA